MRYGFACIAPSTNQCKSNYTLRLQHCVSPLKTKNGAGILTGCPSASPLGLSLGPTNPWLINIAKETLGLRCAGLSPALWLLIPTFSLPNAPPDLAIKLHSSLRCSPTADATANYQQPTTANKKFAGSPAKRDALEVSG